jgi:hypothetical protein
LEITRKISRKLSWFITNIQKPQEKMKVSSTNLLQAFGNPKKKMKVNIFDGSSLAFGNSKKEMEGSFSCLSPSFLCHIHHKNPNIINVTQHWQSSRLKKEYQLCSFVHSRHQILKK